MVDLKVVAQKAKISNIKVSSNKDIPCTVEFSVEGDFSFEETVILTCYLDYQASLISLRGAFSKGLVSRENYQVEERKLASLFSEVMKEHYKVNG
jgi:hypothetical protein